MLPNVGQRKGMVARLARLGVVAVLAVLVVRMLTGQPSEVEVAYQLGEAAKGLVRLDLSYRLQGEQVRSARFQFGARPAPDELVHTVHLLDRDHVVRLELRYGAEIPAPLRARAVPLGGGGHLVSVERPLIVRRSGRVAVFVIGQRSGDEP